MAQMDFHNIKISLIRSERKSIAIQIKPEGVTVRAPRSMSDVEVRRFLESKRSWIEKHLAAMAERQLELEALESFTDGQLRAMADRAREVIPERVRHYAPLIGVDYGRISIRSQRSRWGSCSGKGNLNFNCLLVLMPEEVLDSVVVHELCHRKHMDHSPAFYAEIEKVFPNYKKCRLWLKENGGRYLSRLP